jgi:hypothetical protein
VTDGCAADAAVQPPCATAAAAATRRCRRSTRRPLRPPVHFLLPQLGQLESTARALVDEVASSGAQATPRLRALLASGEQLVASVTRATSQLGARLPDSAALPPAPGRAAVGV